MIEALHFVRPLWLFAFIPLVILLGILYRHHGNSMNWKSVCDDRLLPYIILHQRRHSRRRWPFFLAALAASLCIIAAAGPALEKLPQPVYREQSTLVILLDLSQSMDAGDLKPSRIERAKLKLLDILNSRRAGQTALIVYAADAFTVTPLTDDTHTISSLVPTLETGLMPATGSHAYTAIDRALALLQQASAASGDVLLITDEVTERDFQAVENLRLQGHRLSILGVGTEAGAPISLSGGFLQDRSGAIIIPKLDPDNLQRAALSGGGLYVSIQTNDADISTLNKLFSSRKVKGDNDESAEHMELTADIWQEEGPWLLLLVIPLVALWARRGWLLCFTALIIPMPEPAYALDAESLWRNPDQQAMQLFNAGDANSAAEKFQHNDWKAAAHYRAGNYEKAIEALPKPTTSDDYYNRGNALANLQRYAEAVAAYDEALKLDANNEDAQFNREQVKQAIQQQQQQSGEGESSDEDEASQSDQQDEQDNKNQSGEQSQGEQDQPAENSRGQSQQDQQNSAAENKSPSPTQPQESDEQTEQDSATQNNASDESSEPPAGQHDTSKVEQALNDAQQKTDEMQAEQQTSQLQEAELSEDEQAVEQWLKRVPDNPDQLLRRKFLYQYKNMENKTPSEQSW